MKRKLILAMALSGMALPAMAQDYSLGCKYTQTAGLRWQNNAWESREFGSDAPFVLEVRGGQITPETAKDVLGVSSRPEAVNCLSDSFGDGTCRDDTGGAFYLSHTNLRGAVAQMYGGGMVADSRDDVYVAAFECVRM